MHSKYELNETPFSYQTHEMMYCYLIIATFSGVTQLSNDQNEIVLTYHGNLLIANIHFNPHYLHCTSMLTMKLVWSDSIICFRSKCYFKHHSCSTRKVIFFSNALFSMGNQYIHHHFQQNTITMNSFSECGSASWPNYSLLTHCHHLWHCTMFLFCDYSSFQMDSRKNNTKLICLLHHLCLRSSSPILQISDFSSLLAFG